MSLTSSLVAFHQTKVCIAVIICAIVDGTYLYIHFQRSMVEQSLACKASHFME